MNDRPLLLCRGLHSSRHLLRSLAGTGRYQLVLFKSALDDALMAELGAAVLESLDEPLTGYAVKLAATELALNRETLPAWLPPFLAETLEAAGRPQLPEVLRFVESIKALHRRQPIRALVVNHDLNLWNSTALETARSLGIPSMHVSHTYTFGSGQAGLPHSAASADVTTVWSEQCRADYPPVGELRHRLAATGTPEMDPFFTMRTPEGRRAARQRLGLALERPVISYASTYDEKNSVTSVMTRGAAAEGFRRFLRVFREFASGGEQLIVKLHPSNPMVEEHEAILREEGVAAAHLVGADDGTALAASDLLVCLFPSQVMVDALMLNTPSLWVRAWLRDHFPIYVGAPWLMQVEEADFTAAALHGALDPAHRAPYLAAFEASRQKFNAGADGRATERVIAIIDRMVAATSDSETPWGRRFRAGREAVQAEGRILELLRQMRPTARSNGERRIS